MVSGLFFFQLDIPNSDQKAIILIFALQDNRFSIIKVKENNKLNVCGVNSKFPNLLDG